MSRVISNVLYGVCNSEIENGVFTITEGIKEVGEYAFYERKYLKKITIPKSVIKIGKHAFCDCISLKEIVLPENVQEIGYGAFDCCESLEKIVILNPNAEFLDSSPFYYCPSLKTIIWGAKEHKVECINDICMEIFSRKICKDIEIIHVRYFNDTTESYVAKRGEMIACGDTSRGAALELSLMISSKKI